MARTLTPKDAAALVNMLYKQVTGQSDIAVVNSSDFVSAGEKIMAVGTENVLNALSLLVGRTLVSSRPYTAQLKMMQSLNSGMYTNRVRKVSFYSKFAKNSGMFNTDLYTNLKDGYTNGQNTQADPHSTKSQWEQNQPLPLQLEFHGSSTWQHCLTFYEDQLKVAFRGPDEFASFVNGFVNEHNSDIEQMKESWNRLALVNKIASVYDMRSAMPGSVINLTSGFNTKFGTNYSTAELLTVYAEDFMKYFAAEFKKASKFMTERTNQFHWSVPKTVDGVQHEILRHTPYSDQRVYIYAPAFLDLKTQVYPTIFNPSYLDIDTQVEEVTYWQSIKDRAAIKCVPAVTNTSTGEQVAGAEVDLPMVLAFITDKEGLMTDFQLESARTTNVEARKGYRNTWLTISRNIITDNTENAILFICKDE